MLGDPLFWYGLALKVTMTASIVVVASVAAERSGPFIAALITALPTAASAAYIILALEHPRPSSPAAPSAAWPRTRPWQSSRSFIRCSRSATASCSA
jgi:hypothetical protein